MPEPSTISPAGKPTQPPFFPPTRYRGSKRKLLAWLAESLHELKFDSVADAFSGTGAVSHAMKAAGKRVVSNDVSLANWTFAEALVANQGTCLTDGDIRRMERVSPFSGQATELFADVFYTAEECRWLDGALREIANMPCFRRRALALWCVSQACLAKRPYNLFHRANLDMRTRDVPRSFGNKKTWDTPFPAHFEKFAKQANRAVFPGEKPAEALRGAVEDARFDTDLLYLDPPYMPAKGRPATYTALYHFLEGVAALGDWEDSTDPDAPVKPARESESAWEDGARMPDAFRDLLLRHPRAHVALSYREDGRPKPDDFASILAETGRRVRVRRRPQQYALSKTPTEEVLVVGECR